MLHSQLQTRTSKAVTGVRPSAVPLARLVMPRSMRPREGISTLLRTLVHMQLPGSCCQRWCRHIISAVLLRHVLIACLSISILRIKHSLPSLKVRQKPPSAEGTQKDCLFCTWQSLR